jgi:hypothetical protein
MCVCARARVVQKYKEGQKEIFFCIINNKIESKTKTEN